MAGFERYFNIYAYAKEHCQNNDEVISALNNYILHQDGKGMCEYCIIGTNDMQKIQSLPPWRKATLRGNIFVTIDITTDRYTWNDLRYWLVVPNTIIAQDETTCEITVTYQQLRKMIEVQESLLKKSKEWEYFFSRVKCLPYAQDLIL